MNSLQKIAMVIDADNTQISKLEAVIREISKHGRIVVKRAYGNWKKDTLKNWEGEIKRLAIKAEQQFDYVSGKNATDMALVIDTIELLYDNIYDAFVIVSSDSDYTPLAIKLHESGVYVMVITEPGRRQPARQRECRRRQRTTVIWRRFTNCCASPPTLIRTTMDMSMSVRRALSSSGRNRILTPELTAL